MAQSPDLLLLDEPTNHLDPPGRSALLSLVKNKDISVIAVLHDLPVAEAFADRILVLNESRQVACGTPEAVLQTPVILPVFGMNSFKVAHPVSGKTLRILTFPIALDQPERNMNARVFILLLLLAARSAVAEHFPVTVESCGVPVTFNQAPQRAVINDINMAEMAFALHLQDRIVGLTGITGWYKLTPDFKAAMGTIPELAPKYPALETLLAAQPDFFFAGWNYGMKIGGDVTPEKLARSASKRWC